MQQQQVPQYIPGAQAPQAQAAPVMGVACPTAPGGAQAGGQSAVPQQWQQRMVAIAKPLEQTIPGYQIMASVLEGLAMGQPGAEFSELMNAFHHTLMTQAAALGAIRRFLCGEANQTVLTALAMGVNQFAKAHGELRPQFERLVASLPAEQRGAFSGLAQVFTAAENQLNQAGTLIQSTVGPQAWETVRAQVWDAQAPRPERTHETHQPEPGPQTLPAPQPQAAPQPQQMPQFTMPWSQPESPVAPQWWQQLPGMQMPGGAQPQTTQPGAPVQEESTTP